MSKTPGEPVLALSIRQPWAWLMVNGPKDIENRKWRRTIPKEGLPIWIHAGLEVDLFLWRFERLWRLAQRLKIAFPPRYELGGIIGRAVITECVSKHDSEWFEGPFGFVLADRRPVPFRRCRGMLGFFKPQFDLTSKNAKSAKEERK